MTEPDAAHCASGGGGPLGGCGCPGAAPQPVAMAARVVPELQRGCAAQRGTQHASSLRTERGGAARCGHGGAAQDVRSIDAPRRAVAPRVPYTAPCGGTHMPACMMPGTPRPYGPPRLPCCGGGGGGDMEGPRRRPDVFTAPRALRWLCGCCCCCCCCAWRVCAA
jgi:hypothetical protein